jgi:NADH:ubiquinone oxidoreductase subunit 3 (subunit A)
LPSPIESDPTEPHLTFILIFVLTGLLGLSLLVSLTLVLIAVKDKRKAKNYEIGKVRVEYSADNVIYENMDRQK